MPDVIERARPDLQAIDFDQSPFIVIWELTTVEGFGLIEAVSRFGRPAPLLVFTGGDPLRRPDVFDLVSSGTERGLRVALTPSGTAAVRREKILRLRACGLARLAVSLDGSTAEIHGAFSSWSPRAGAGRRMGCRRRNTRRS